MAELAYRQLSKDEIEKELQQVAGWAIEDGQLARTFTFKAYKDGVVFTSAVGYIADKLDHHPDITLTYGKVRVAVNTHSVGGISPYDFELARRIDRIES
jgi:4a-hydroxytetrahydrobiopterin dehydratase